MRKGSRFLYGSRTDTVTAMIRGGKTERAYYVYVIALSPEVLQHRRFAARNPEYRAGKACLYVGSSALSPERRFEQHLNGYRSNWFVEWYGVELLPRLYEHRNPLASRADAERAERELAEALRAEGFGVWYG